MIYPLIKRLYGERFRKELYDNEQRPKGFDGMSFAFTDGKKDYYSWPGVEHMPLVRTKQLEAAMIMIDAGIGTEDLKKLGNAMIEACNDVIAAKSTKDKDKEAAKVAVMAREMMFRREEIIPEEAYYMMAATCCVREDEKQDVWDQVIQRQKEDLFKDQARAGNPFFLAAPAFKAALRPSLTTVEGLSALLISWMRQEQRDKMILTLSGSPSASASSTTA